MALVVTEVRRASERRRFHEVGRVLFADEPRWAPPVSTYERWLFSRAHPYPGDVARWIVWRGRTVVGRICAHHVAGDEAGWFGAFECADDAEAARVLVEVAAVWLRDRGAARILGPATFTTADEAGVLLSGFEHAGGTGRPWHPPWYAEHLATAGLEPADRTWERWRLAAAGDLGRGLSPGGALPPHAGRLADRRLTLEGAAGVVAAVPDVSATTRATSLRARPAPPTEASVVRCEGDPAVLVPALLGAAGAAGYRTVWAPWSPDEDRPPDTVHALLTSWCNGPVRS